MFSEINSYAICATWPAEYYCFVCLAKAWHVRFENYRRYSNRLFWRSGHAEFSQLTNNLITRKGLIISLLYCFLNADVQAEIGRKFRNWWWAERYSRRRYFLVIRLWLTSISVHVALFPYRVLSSHLQATILEVQKKGENYTDES